MILHRQGTQPRLIDSSEHSSINLNLRKRISTGREYSGDFEFVQRVSGNWLQSNSQKVRREWIGRSFAA